MSRSKLPLFRPLARAVLSLALVSTLAVGCTPGTGSGGGPGGKADDLDDLLPAKTPKRVIWMIGDGMGVAQVTAAAYASDEPLNMLGMSEFGFISTHEHEYVTTDSAASATAMASGIKTHFEAVGVLPGTSKDTEDDSTNHLRTIIDVAQDADWRTGIVATTSLVDATPAAFAAHRSSRRSKTDIALDLRHSGIDVMISGGLKFFEDRSDSQNLVNQLRNAGYSVAKTAAGLRSVAGGTKTKVVGLLADKDMPELLSGERAMELPEMVEKALLVLDRDNDDGFFLMVEGSWIDRASHAVDGEGMVAETLEFDRAVGVALAYARQRDDTLVIVTADHETGGLAILDPDTANGFIDTLGGKAAVASKAAFPNSFSIAPTHDIALGQGALMPTEVVDPQLVTNYGFLSVASRPFFTGPGVFFKSTHTFTIVPLFAEGPGAEFVIDVRDNAELGIRVQRLVEEDGAEGEDPEPAEIEAPKKIIVVTADGAGLSALTAARYINGPLATLNMKVRGLVATHSVDRLVNDQAGAATSIATGKPTRSGALGMSFGAGGLVPATSLLERAEIAGLKTGLVTSGSVTDPVLAAYYMHSEDIGEASDRAAAFARFAVGDGFDIAFGGGADDFTAEDLDALSDGGATVEMSWSSSAAGLDERLVRLIASGDLDSASERFSSGSDQPTLEEMTRVAIESLDKGGDDFLLVVHAAGLGDRLSAMDRTASLVDEVVDLDGAVKAALAYAAGRDDTVVIVLGLRDSTLSVIDNHYGFHKKQCGVAVRCGGDELFIDLPVAVGDVQNGDGLDDVALQGDFTPSRALLQYGWLPYTAHLDNDGAGSGSANFTPLFAAGAGAELLAGFHQHADVGSVLANWLTD